MSLSLKQSQAVSDMASILYDFLPGSGNAAWKGHVSFKTVAEHAGVGEFWQAGSKLPMITALLQKTLERRRDRFESLVLEIVRAGIPYRQKQNSPLRPDEIAKLNGCLLDVGFKFPDLWDADFLGSLSLDRGARARSRVDEVIAQDQFRASEASRRTQERSQIKEAFFSLHLEPTP